MICVLHTKSVTGGEEGSINSKTSVTYFSNAALALSNISNDCGER